MDKKIKSLPNSGGKKAVLGKVLERKLTFQKGGRDRIKKTS